MKPDYSDIRSWIWGINPATTSEMFDGLIARFMNSYKETGKEEFLKLANEYQEAREAYSK